MSDFDVKELENICERLLKSNKPKIIAAKFSSIKEITEEQHRHFISANKYGKYLWQAHPHEWDDNNKDLHMGVLLDENLNYVHIVFVSTEVLWYILNLKGD